MHSTSRTAFYRANLGLPLLLALMVFVLFDLAGLDQTFSNLIYDPSIGLFPFGT